MKEKVIQFGEGNFLRGFVDYFIDGLNKKGLFDGSVVFVQPIPTGPTATVNAQNGKYNLFLRGIQNGKEINERTEINCVKRAVNPYEDFDAYLQLAHIESMRFIVSNTTEAGIVYDESCGFDDKPQTSFPAKLTRLLYERYKANLEGFIILPCELIDDNGKKLQNFVKQYANQWNLEADFLNWIDESNHFCNTLVDRIVTGYPKEEVPELLPQIGWDDKLIDTGEIFHLWVIEGDFENELPLQKAGYNVIFTNDVKPYKTRKVRLLNGAHTSMVAPAMLCGIETVLQCINDENIFAFLNKCMFNEILPVLGDNEENRHFANDVLERFKNPYIKHQLKAISLNSISKFSVRVLPSIIEYKNEFGTYPLCLTSSLAFLLYYYKNQNPTDLEWVTDYIKSNTTQDILKNEELWGTSLSEMTDTVLDCYKKIEANGAKETVKWILSK